MGQVILCWDIIKKEMIANHFDKAAANDNAENGYGDKAAKVVDSRGRT